MNSFTKKERIVILVVVFIIIIALTFKVFMGKKSKSSSMIMELSTMDEVEAEEDEIHFDKEDENLEIMVHISGEVYKPGIIILELGKRLIDATELAGGLKKDADLDRINLAKKLSDEEKIYIPKIGEEINMQIETLSMESSGEGRGESGKTDINTCTKEELIRLPGIGEVIAGRIIDFRENNPFKSIDDIKSVSGIGDKKFQGIQELIIVK